MPTMYGEKAPCLGHSVLEVAFSASKLGLV